MASRSSSSNDAVAVEMPHSVASKFHLYENPEFDRAEVEQQYFDAVPERDSVKVPSGDRSSSDGHASDDDDDDTVAKLNSETEAPVRVFLKFENVKYKVLLPAPPPAATIDKSSSGTSSSHHKYILHGITGSVAPGEILAMMGPSGSGKTTLLKILAGRLLKDISGSVTFNDVPYGSFMKKRIGFVAQEDVLFPYLTVQECLEFTAMLRLPNTMTRSQKICRADKVLKDLGLERCRRTIIGGPFIPGVSGGERKRTSIGCEILIDPSLLLLDEPTSGLDSATALKILRRNHTLRVL